MAMLNRLPGGTRSSLRAVHWLLATGRPASLDPVVLDIGTGAGDFARRIADRARVLAADIHPQVLRIARSNLGGTRGVRVLRADARELPLADGEVDVVHASLLLHHLDPHEVGQALGEMRRVARLGVVVNDLRRSRLAYLLTSAAVLVLARGAWTRHDGLASARRAYTTSELDDLASRAGLRPARRSWTAMPRVTTVYVATGS